MGSVEFFWVFKGFGNVGSVMRKLFVVEADNTIMCCESNLICLFKST